MTTIPPRRSDLLVFHVDEPFMYVFPTGDDPYNHEPSQEELLEANVELFARSSAIPLQNRLRYLIGDEEQEAYDPYRYTDLDELAGKLGATPEELASILVDLRIPDDAIRHDEKSDQSSISSKLEIVVAEEFEWRKIYDELSELVSIPAMADIFDVGQKIVKNILDSSQVLPRRLEHHGVASYGDYYPKTLLHRVRAEILNFPPARQNKTLNKILGEVGCGQKWALARSGGFATDIMWSAKGDLLEHYPPEFQQTLELERRQRPEASSDNKRTMRQMAHELDRDYEWVKSRLIKYHRNKETVYRNGHARIVYDDFVFQALRKASEEQRNLPVISDHEATLDQFVQPLNTSHEMAGRAVKRLGLQPHTRRSAVSGKVLKAYDRTIIVPLAQAIVEDREHQITYHQTVIDTLSPRPLEALTTKQRQHLTKAKQVIGHLLRDLERARSVRDNLPDDIVSQQW